MRFRNLLPILHDSIQEAAWTNQANGRFFSLYWNKAKWLLEEMADGSPIPSSRGIGTGEKLSVVNYEMPQVEAYLKNKYPHQVFFSASTIREAAHIKSDDSGQVARDKLVSAHAQIFHDAIRDLEENGRDYHAALLKKLLPDILKRATWKKVSMKESGPISMANAGPFTRPFGPMISRAQHDDDLDSAFEQGRRYISGGGDPGDEAPNNVETPPVRRFKRR